MGQREGLQLTVPTLANRSRSIVLCLDNKVDGSYRNTNVARFYSLLLKSINERQLVFYRAFEKPSFVSGDSEKRQVIQVYQFLSENYRVGDKISVFGCSYGAQIASILAGMVHKMGIISSGNNNMELIYVAYKLYQSGSDSERHIFKDTYSASANIRLTLLGIWDTNPNEDCLPPAASLDTFRHALALDETCPPVEWFPETAIPDVVKERKCLSLAERPADVLEVWFSGTHDDVCGGVTSGELGQPSLSRLSLRWMVRQCFEVQTDILFDEDKLQLIGLSEYQAPDTRLRYLQKVSRDDVLKVLANLRAQQSCESPSEKKGYSTYSLAVSPRISVVSSMGKDGKLVPTGMSPPSLQLTPIDDSCDDSEAVKQKRFQLRPKTRKTRNPEDVAEDLQDENVDSTSQPRSSTDLSREAVQIELRRKSIRSLGRSRAQGGRLDEDGFASSVMSSTIPRSSILRRKKRNNTRKSTTDSSLSPADDLSSGDDAADESDDDDLVEEQNPQKDPEFSDALCIVHDSIKPSRSWKQLWRQCEQDGYRNSLNIALPLVRITSKAPTPMAMQQPPPQYESSINVHQSVEWRIQARSQLNMNKGREPLPLRNIDLNGQGPSEVDSQLVEGLKNYTPRVKINQLHWVA